MTEKSYPYRAENPASNIIKIFFGAVMVIAGMIVSAWILMMIYTMIMTQESIFILDRFNFREQAEALISSAAEKTMLPEELFLIIGYIIVIVLLAMATKIARVLLQSGTSLLHADLNVVARKLRDELVNTRDDY